MEQQRRRSRCCCDQLSDPLDGRAALESRADFVITYSGVPAPSKHQSPRHCNHVLQTCVRGVVASRGVLELLGMSTSGGVRATMLLLLQVSELGPCNGPLGDRRVLYSAL